MQHPIKKKFFYLHIVGCGGRVNLGTRVSSALNHRQKREVKCLPLFLPSQMTSSDIVMHETIVRLQASLLNLPSIHHILDDAGKLCRLDLWAADVCRHACQMKAARLATYYSIVPR